MHQEDAFIQKQVEEALKNSRLLRTVDIKIDVRNGEVALYGLVDVLAEKWTAGEIAAQVPGVAAVDNSLTIAIDRQLQDNEIAESVQQLLQQDPRPALHLIKATVKSGAVYLEGDISTLAEEDAARRIAAKTQGVKEVVSYLHQIDGGFGFDDATVTNAVETALSRTTMVSARDVETITAAGVVTLRGTVDTAEQIAAAQLIASRVPGVKRIDNQLISRHGTGETDFRLTNAIRQALGDNGLGGVKCFVVDRTAFLDGAVGVPEQKEAAEEIVGRFTEITGVSNDIQIS